MRHPRETLRTMCDGRAYTKRKAFIRNSMRGEFMCKISHVSPSSSQAVVTARVFIVCTRRWHRRFLGRSVLCFACGSMCFSWVGVCRFLGRPLQTHTHTQMPNERKAGNVAKSHMMPTIATSAHQSLQIAVQPTVSSQSLADSVVGQTHTFRVVLENQPAIQY